MIKGKHTVIDLFCGCGGLSQGFIEAGYEVVLGIDNWKDAVQTFEKNHNNSKGVIADLFIETPAFISKKTGIKKVDLIIGGPPCQGFSIAGKQIVDDERNKLYKSFVNFVDYYKPQAFLMENVPNIVSIGKGMAKDNIIEDFEKLGYKVVYKVLLASEFGVPQNRRRTFFVGLLSGEEFSFPVPFALNGNQVTAFDAISDLPSHSIVDGTNYPLKPKSNYQNQIRENCKAVYNHEITNHNDQTVEIISMVPDGGNYKNLPIELQKTRNVNIAWTRLNSKKPSFTIDTGHRHHFHYEFNRVPTVRESARIQSFSDTFIFYGSKTSQYKQVGNAVPPLLAKHIAIQLKKYINA
ncbi:MAG: DNA cytosine methyltransferase [Bacteroidales bacterium]|nr:MAG: DNA cytosine methyltransferase [Bacteroidales bacterium]